MECTQCLGTSGRKILLGKGRTSGFEVAKRSNNPVTPMVQWYKDKQLPPPTQRVTFTTQPFFKAGDGKVKSGLIGPVTVSFSQTKVID